MHSDHNNISPPCIPQRTLKPCSDSICKQQYAARFKSQKRGTHYHCLYCPYKYHSTKRVIKHIDICRHVTQPAPVQLHKQGTNTKQLSPEPEVFDVTESALEPVTLLMCNTTLGSNASPDSFEFNPRYGSSPNCMVTARKDRDCQKHYHCPNCWSCTCDRKPRLRQHYDKCLTTRPTQDTSNSAKVHANITVKPKLQSAIVDSKQGINIYTLHSCTSLSLFQPLIVLKKSFFVLYQLYILEKACRLVIKDPGKKRKKSSGHPER